MRYLTTILMMTLVVLLATVCSETTQFLMTGPSGTGTVVGGGAPINPALVSEVRLAPSFVKIKNGDEVRVRVTTFAAGGVEILAPFSPAIEGEQIVQILPATPSSTANREVILRARGVGECTLVVRSGDVRGMATITVSSAN